MPTISTKDTKALIFDMDGTMVDNMSIHKKAWREFCRQKGIALSDTDFEEKVFGFTNNKIFSNIFGDNLSSDQRVRLAEEKESLYRKLYKPLIKEISGLTTFIAKAKKLDLKLAVATSAPKGNRDFILQALHLEKYFDVILGEEDIKKGKPNPEIYLKVAELLNVSPADCLIFEDSPAGVEAGKNAEMKVIGVAPSYPKNSSLKTDIVIPDFSELTFA